MQFAVQHNQRNCLKGILWGVGGSALTPSTLGITALAASYIVAGSLGSLAAPRALPLLLVGAVAIGSMAYASVKFTGVCFQNAVHHLGPEYQIVKA